MAMLKTSSVVIILLFTCQLNFVQSQLSCPKEDSKNEKPPRIQIRAILLRCPSHKYASYKILNIFHFLFYTVVIEICLSHYEHI